LRHFPDDAGLASDTAGWTVLDGVIDRAGEAYGINCEAGRKPIHR